MNKITSQTNFHIMNKDCKQEDMCKQHQTQGITQDKKDKCGEKDLKRYMSTMSTSTLDMQFLQFLINESCKNELK